MLRFRNPGDVRARVRAKAGCPVAALCAARSQHEERKALLVLRVCEDTESFGPGPVTVPMQEAEQRQLRGGGSPAWLGLGLGLGL